MSQDDYLGTALSVTVVDDGYRHDYKHGPWGQLLAWDPATMSYSREVRPPRPPLTSRPMAPLPEPDPLTEVTARIGCPHPDSSKYIGVKGGKDVVRCRDCKRQQNKRYQERHKAA